MKKLSLIILTCAAFISTYGQKAEALGMFDQLKNAAKSAATTAKETAKKAATQTAVNMVNSASNKLIGQPLIPGQYPHMNPQGMQQMMPGQNAPFCMPQNPAAQGWGQQPQQAWGNSAAGGYPQQQMPGSGGYPQQQMPNAGGYPQQQMPNAGGYPQQQMPNAGGYPQQQMPNAGGYQQNPWG